MVEAAAYGYWEYWLCILFPIPVSIPTCSDTYSQSFSDRIEAGVHPAVLTLAVGGHVVVELREGGGAGG